MSLPEISSKILGLYESKNAVLEAPKKLPRVIEEGDEVDEDGDVSMSNVSNNISRKKN